MISRSHTQVALFGTAALLVGSAHAVPVTIEALDLRGTGVFGDDADAAPVYTNHMANVTGATLNGGAFPGPARTQAPVIDFTMTYNNLDLDGDATANDSVTFTVSATKVDFDMDGNEGGFLASFGQGIDTGFGNLNDLEVTVKDVSGTTTDSGATIVFDGFTGAAVLAGTVGPIDVSAEVNGTTISISAPDSSPTFQFPIESIDFAPTPMVQFGNSMQLGGNTPSIVARHYDLQFSAEAGPGGLEGDYSGDGFVSQSDLDLVLLNWGANVAPAGFDEDNLPGGGPFDGLMSQNELDGVLLNWGDGTPPALTAVPEPGSLALIAGLGLIGLRRRA